MLYYVLFYVWKRTEARKTPMPAIWHPEKGISTLYIMPDKDAGVWMPLDIIQRIRHRALCTCGIRVHQHWTGNIRREKAIRSEFLSSDCPEVMIFTCIYCKSFEDISGIWHIMQDLIAEWGKIHLQYTVGARRSFRDDETELGAIRYERTYVSLVDGDILRYEYSLKISIVLEDDYYLTHYTLEELHLYI